MSRRRYISTQVSIDRAVNELAVKCGDFAALLYTWMIPHAGDDCTVPADAGEVLVTVVPWRRDKSEQDVQRAIDAMLELHLLERCEDPRWLRFPPESFYKYQSYIKPERQSPAPAAQNSAEQRNSPQNIASVSVSSSHIDSLRERVAIADAPPKPKKVKAAKEPGLSHAPIYDAFATAGRPRPIIETRPEKDAAQYLLKHFRDHVSEIPECMDDIAAGRYGGPYERRKLSLHLLASDNIFQNWLRWKQEGKPEMDSRPNPNVQRSPRYEPPAPVYVEA